MCQVLIPRSIQPLHQLPPRLLRQHHHQLQLRQLLRPIYQRMHPLIVRPTFRLSSQRPIQHESQACTRPHGHPPKRAKQDRPLPHRHLHRHRFQRIHRLMFHRHRLPIIPLWFPPKIHPYLLLRRRPCPLRHPRLFQPCRRHIIQQRNRRRCSHRMRPQPHTTPHCTLPLFHQWQQLSLKELSIQMRKDLSHPMKIPRTTLHKVASTQ
mmetsp:Transcript_48107/g.79744  ORF Transcript_48107/g.79744 Transcript_48107/m.79744 type:complete len:208 (+) Transcript_48107:347-970(+)